MTVNKVDQILLKGNYVDPNPDNATRKIPENVEQTNEGSPKSIEKSNNRENQVLNNLKAFIKAGAVFGLRVTLTPILLGTLIVSFPLALLGFLGDKLNDEKIHSKILEVISLGCFIPYYAAESALYFLFK